MDIAVYTLTSPLHDEKATNAVSADFIAGIEERMGFGMDFRGPDFSGYGSHDLDLVFVRTGGTEGLFKEVFPSLEGRIVLLTSGKSNSLAASMEILSYLNQQGREGDVPALLSMSIGQALTGTCGFQANPSRIDPESGEMIFAHCTIPFDMVRKYSFNTHFESGIGIAVHGEMPEGDATIFKISGDLSRHFCCSAELLRNQYENNLCRTQIVLKIKENASSICRDYFLSRPVGNHHIVFTGNHTSHFEAFMASVRA